jgi:RNA polymerase primary sigma factor
MRVGNPSTEWDAVSSYLADIRKKRPLSRDQEQQLLNDVDRGEDGARDELVECNLSFVVRVAGEYRGLGLSFEDMLNEGNLGLLEAARRFDPQRGVKFITYAIWWIRKTILHAISEKSNLVRVPYVQQRRAETIRRVEARLRTQLGRDPSRLDVARELGMGVREIEKALQARTKPYSLARPAQDEGTTTAEEFLTCARITQEQRIIDREAQRGLERAFVRLTEQQRIVIVLRFGLGDEPPLTLQQAGQRMGLSRERIRQVEKQALEIMRRRISPSARWRSVSENR